MRSVNVKRVGEVDYVGVSNVAAVLAAQVSKVLELVEFWRLRCLIWVCINIKTMRWYCLGAHQS